MHKAKVPTIIEKGSEAYEFDTRKEAAAYIGVYPTYINSAIKKNQLCKGWWVHDKDTTFERPTQSMFKSTRGNSIIGICKAAQIEVRFDNCADACRKLTGSTKLTTSVTRKLNSGEEYRGWTFISDDKRPCSAFESWMADFFDGYGRDEAARIGHETRMAREELGLHVPKEEKRKQPADIRYYDSYMKEKREREKLKEVPGAVYSWGYYDSEMIGTVCPCCKKVLSKMYDEETGKLKHESDLTHIQQCCAGKELVEFPGGRLRIRIR